MAAAIDHIMVVQLIVETPLTAGIAETNNRLDFVHCYSLESCASLQLNQLTWNNNIRTFDYSILDNIAQSFEG
jgi:hypothetical protein